MAYQRHQRVKSLIQEELSNIILRELEFPGILMTITEADVQKDMDFAIIYFSVIPSKKAGEALKILEKNRKRLEYLLLKKLNIWRLPKLRFKIDLGPEKAAEIEKKFIDIEENNG